ncbi:MAG: hypothetical protein N3G21_06025 [Candidatus Hydrogenedentes bacterium]|nr:hypothetical protein [Candidatus Hydrogenedentota bacterium]
MESKRVVGKFEKTLPSFVHVDVKEVPKLPKKPRQKVLFVAI